MASSELIDNAYNPEKSPASFLKDMEKGEEPGKKEIEKTEYLEGNENALHRYRVILAGLPVLAIAFAEMLIYGGSIKEAIWAHTLLLIALAAAIPLVRDLEVKWTYQALMLLPVLRIVNLSMPIFYDDPLYAFAFIYAPLAVPVTIVAINQKITREQLGLISDRLWLYIPLSLVIGLFLAFGEYTVIQPEASLLPELSFLNLLQLILVMTLFIGLIEELIFRSILQTRLTRLLGPAAGILLASLLFGLMHSGYGTPYEILYTAFVGVFLGQLFHRTGSLPLVVLTHGFLNVFLFGILPLAGT